MDVWPVRAVRGLSGVVAGGVLMLLIVVGATAVLGAERGFPGPGAASLTWHVVAAITVVVLQWQADRRHGLTAALAALLVFVAAFVLLWTQWWS